MLMISKILRMLLIRRTLALQITTHAVVVISCVQTWMSPGNSKNKNNKSSNNK